MSHFRAVCSKRWQPACPQSPPTAGGTPEAIVSGENGLLVQPDNAQALADAIAQMMRDPERYTRMGIRAAVDVRQRWEFTHYIDRLESHYRAIVRGHQPGHPIHLHTLADES
uniref:Glycos_transf_1 n=1 Tax=uncultured Carboxydothermus sp. TaxID=263864 RepID=A0A060C4V4_9THEO|nr:Glycos_transf_1 [uncultured Carboxydothermus sp.]